MKSVFVFSLLVMALGASGQQPGAFTHPGILHTDADLTRIRKHVRAGDQPWKDGFEALRSHKYASADYGMQGPFESVSRERKLRLHAGAIEHDSNAAYYNALLWAIKGDKAHAAKAIEILNAWSKTLKTIVGEDAELLSGLDGAQLVNAAELLRYSNSGWKPEDIARCEKMFREIFYPIIKEFAPRRNGNWGNACIKTVMAIGVFCNDRQMFESGVDYFRNGKGNASIGNYVYETGQCQESGRDQAHAQLGLGNLAEACEIGHSQGLDMYGALENRLLAGFEYTAKYNLGEEVPFAMRPDVNNKYRFEKISGDHRGDFRPIYEMALAHYRDRTGLDTPYTAKVVEKIRPEGAGPRPADQPGFGTLLFALKPLR